MLSVLYIFAIVSLSSLATPFASRWEDVHEKHSWSSVPDEWTNLGHTAADTTIDLHIALKAQNESALIDALNEVSSPDHPKYGKHLSKEKVAELVAPPTEVLELVNAWLEHHGILSSSTVITKHGGSQLTLIGVPVSRANDLLGASYQLYHHIGTNTTVLRTLSYGLPEALLECVQTVVPTTNFGFPDSPWQNSLMRRGDATVAQPQAPASERGKTFSSRVTGENVTPALLRSLYRTSAYVPTAANLNVLAVGGFKNEYPSPYDLVQFMKTYRADGTFATYTVALVNGGAYNPSNPAMEPSVDIQYSIGVAYPTRHIFYSTSGTNGDRLTSWLEYMLDQISVPQTITLSYGFYEHRISPEYATYACNLFARLGLRGASILAASGDDGVVPGTACSTTAAAIHISSSSLHFPQLVSVTASRLGNSTQSLAHSTFYALAGPWVTSVGGTTGYGPEVAAAISGGGFSAYFPQPPYQDHAVPTFLQNLGSKYYGLYNAGGRGVPDIALQARDFEFILNGQREIVSGTSCAAPAAAGIISLLNDYMITSGRRPLGFLNPWLYGGGLAGLNDITQGSNPGCNTPGFSAIPGWDPVTGLGTLDFANLGELLSYGF
ncbi:subtilisin-like protein [Lactarius quietus]|nr:subtilisin-like protein [Lactarius quietus]